MTEHQLEFPGASQRPEKRSPSPTVSGGRVFAFQKTLDGGTEVFKVVRGRLVPVRLRTLGKLGNGE